MTKKQYLLVVLAEECAEVAKAASKALRFGMTKYKPGGDETNRARLERELAEVVAVAEMLGLRVRDEHKREKVMKLNHYMDVSRRCGMLDKFSDSTKKNA